MTDIALDSTTSINGEIVLSERKVTEHFKVVELHEHVVNRFVRATIELGPFVEETNPMGETVTRGSGQRSMNVWSNEEYDEVSLTWDNTTLVAKIKEILESEI